MSFKNKKNEPVVTEADPYILEITCSPYTWKSYLRSTGSLGKRWLRRKVRQDWKRHPMAPGIDLITFWLDQRIGGGGTGVCISIFCHGYEVLRFDCFGSKGEPGHYHITPFTPWAIFGNKVRRILFKEKTVEEQIDRALFEIRENLNTYLQMNPKRSIRKTRIEQEKLIFICDTAHRQLHEYLEKIDVLKKIL